MKELLMDGDIFVYRAASAVEVEIDWGDDNWYLGANLDEAITAFTVMIQEVQAAFPEKTKLRMCLSDPLDNFRKHVFLDYKSNRRGVRKPVVFKPLLAHVMAEYTTTLMSGCEADDVMGIYATRYPLVSVVVSPDKDLRSIPCDLYNPFTKELRQVSHDDADRWHIYQTLIGDTTDGYPGCPGVGPVRAEKLMAGVPTPKLWVEVVLPAYAKAGKTKADALKMARVARILRADEYDVTGSKPLLWNPPE